MRRIGWAFLLLASGCVKAKPATGPVLPRRDLELTFDVRVADVPAGTKSLTIWVPLPRDERVQVLQSVSPAVENGTTKIVADQAHANPALEVTIPNPAADVEAKITVGVSRVEEKAGAGGHPLAQPSFAGEDLPDPWLKDDVNDDVRAIAKSLFQDGMPDDSKARAAFDFVLAHPTDETRACMDFIALCRAGAVPARFRVGFRIPTDPGSGVVAGDHCWAEYHSKARGWVPVDVAEAAKQPEKKEYLFGALDPDRIGISLGRDITFDGQKGAPLGDFAFPYAEVDGSPWTVSTTVHWSDRR